MPSVDTAREQIAKEMQERFNKGLRGLLDRVTGKYRQLKEQNELEAFQTGKRDREEYEALLERIVDADSSTVMNAFEKKIKTLEDEKIVLQEKIAGCECPSRGHGETYRTAKATLSFNELDGFCAQKMEMVGPPGLEPGTKGFAVLIRFRMKRTISSPSTASLGAGRSGL